MQRFLVTVACGLSLLALNGLLPETALAQTPTATPRPDYPPSAQVLADYNQIATAPDSRALWTLYKHKKDERVLAELPPQFASQKYYIAPTVAGGEMFAGLQAEPLYVYWRKYGTRLALMEPNIDIRSNGDNESRASVSRLFTDSVILETSIVTMGPNGGPIIDLTQILVGNAPTFLGNQYRITNPALVTHKKVKAFPDNIEIAIEAPMMDSGRSMFGPSMQAPSPGRLKTLHYSISVITPNPAYQPRVADPRIGYFTTGYVDLGKYKENETKVRFINRWSLQKRDPSLKLSPPVKPIRFILEHTVPVRYRRWVSQGVLYWNKAFEKVGILDAIEVDYQDAQTGRNMDIDPEDVRYNFIRWLNNNVGTAIGPSRVNPLTGEILDADIILTDGWIRHFWKQFDEVLPAVAMEGFNPETLAWLSTRPQWDPRVRLASPSHRADVLRQIQRESRMPLSGHAAGRVDTKLLGDDVYDGLIGRKSQTNGLCLAAEGKTLELAMMHMEFVLQEAAQAEKKEEEKKKEDEKKDEKKEEKKDDAKKDEPKKEEPKKDEPKKEEPKKDELKKDESVVDGMPESFIGPLLAELVAHEVGHTLGLRHNFKASSVYDLKAINSNEMKGKKSLAGSVMDYTSVNLNVGGGEIQGDYTMIGVGPYDEWAIEFGYSLSSDLKPILARVNEPELIYGTDEDTGGPDPRSRRYDFSKNPLDYAQDQMRLVKKARERLLKAFVKDGDNWFKARQGYELTLAMQTRSLSMMANWIGGAFTNRSLKGDKNAPKPIEVVPVDRQRAALKFAIENAFRDDAFGLSPELLQHLTVEKWIDDRRAFTDEETWAVHDRIIGIQSSVLTMLMNPTTLRRVYDNELRVSADQDALTLPEVLTSVSEALWSELKENPTKQFTARVPMVTSLRANLQREHVDRLVDLALPGSSFSTEAYKPISNLATLELTKILGQVNRVLTEAKDKVDPYTVAHFEKLKEKITKVRDGQFIYNASDIGGGGGGLILLFGNEQTGPQPLPPASQPSVPAASNE